MLKDEEKVKTELEDKDNFIDTSDLINNEILQIKDDRLFHDLFNAHETSTIEWIAKEILGCSIEEVHGKVFVSTTRLTRVRKEERSKYVDLLIEQANGEFILIELNNNYYGKPAKSIFYAVNILSSYYDRDVMDKNKSKKVYVKPVRGILVNLNWSPPKAEARKKANPGKIITDWNYPSDSTHEYRGYCLRILSINLDFYNDLGYDSIKKEDRLFKLLTVKNEKELNELTKDIKELDSYVSKLKDLSCSANYRGELMTERMMRNLNIQYEFSSGYSMGVDDNKREMILNLNAQQVPLEVIAKASELTLEEVQDIIKDSQNEKENG